MTRTDVRADAQRWRRGDAFAIVGALVLGAVLAMILISIQGLRNDLQVANEARDALATQVEGLGATPIAGKPGSRGDVGPSGDPGLPGSPGKAGSTGKTGKTGKTGPAGATGAAGPTGSPGADGSPGVQGAAGTDGEDGADGANGKDGTNGADGTDGDDGTDGAPPAGWTYTDPDGVTYTCTPVSDFDAASPRYTCTADASPPPHGNALSLLGGASLAAYRRRL